MSDCAHYLLFCQVLLSAAPELLLQGKKVHQESKHQRFKNPGKKINTFAKSLNLNDVPTNGRTI